MAGVIDLESAYNEVNEILNDYSADETIYYEGSYDRYTSNKKYEFTIITPFTKFMSDSFNKKDLFYYKIKLDDKKYMPFIIMYIQPSNSKLTNYLHDRLYETLIEGTDCKYQGKMSSKEPFLYWNYICFNKHDSEYQIKEIQTKLKENVENVENDKNVMKIKENCIKSIINTNIIKKLKMDHPDYFLADQSVYKVTRE